MRASRSRLPVAVAALCLVQFMDVLGVTVVVTSLPAMLSSLHAAQSDSTLIATGYAMCFGGLLMLGARLGDRYGHRRTMLAAPASVPCALRLLTTVAPDGPPRRRAIAAWSAGGGGPAASSSAAS